MTNPVRFPTLARRTGIRVRCYRANSGGFSLVEVLISVIILSFGMLGMVGLQAAAIQANRDARLQSVASALARELAEMMRGNKQVGLAAGSANPYLGEFSNPGAATPLVPATVSYCLNVGATACATPTATANAEMTDWLARVDAELPGARVVICVDALPFDASTGLPVWACSSGTGATTVIKIGWTRNSTNRAVTGTLAFDRALTPAIVLPITPGAVL